MNPSKCSVPVLGMLLFTVTTWGSSGARADDRGRVTIDVNVNAAPAPMTVDEAKARWLFKKKAEEKWYRLMMYRKGNYGRVGVREARLAGSSMAASARESLHGAAVPSEFVERISGRGARTEFRKAYRAVEGSGVSLSAGMLDREELERARLERYYVRTRRSLDLDGEQMTIRYLPGSSGPASVDRLTGRYSLGAVHYRTTIAGNGVDDDCDGQSGRIVILGGGGGGGGTYHIDSFFDVFVTLDGPLTPGGAMTTINNVRMEKREESCDGLDNDCDGIIEEEELVLFQLCYTGQDDGPITPECLGSDIDGDNDVDGPEWQVVKQKYMEYGLSVPQIIPPGKDCYDVVPGETYVEFGGASALPPIPADFFFPGSLPFEARIPLMQRRWAQQAEAGEANPRPWYVMEREEWADLSAGDDSVPISLVGITRYEWDFDSVAPITVSDTAGNEKEYLVRLTVTDNNSPAKAAHIVGDGASIDSFFDIYIEVSIDTKFWEYWPGMAGIGDRPPDRTHDHIGQFAMESNEPHAWAKKKEADRLACEEMQDFYAKKADEVELAVDMVGIGRVGALVLTPLSAAEACCLRDATCVDAPVRECAAMLGDPQGPGTSCAAGMIACSASKWAQPPVPGTANNMFYGWNQYSVWDMPGQGPSQIVADDWVCDTNAPVSDLHWRGSYVGWRDPVPPGSLQQPPVDHFHILIWTDVPAGPNEPFSHPGEVIWEVIRSRTDVNEQFVGWDFNPATNTFDAAFHYDLDLQLPEWFYQDPTPGAHRIYWVTIAACYEPNPIFPMPYPWGWKTRPRDINSPAPDAAVTIVNPWWATLGSTYQSGEPICWPGPSPCGLADQWDMAFELTSKTQVSVFKWEQGPDLTSAGMDVNATYPFIAADDFLCETTGPLSQVSIVGSWLHDLLPDGGAGNVSFTLRLHADVPAAAKPNGPWSAPGNLLWSRTFAPGDFFVQPLATGLTEGWMEPPSYYDPAGDSVAYTYVFNLTPGEFVQNGTAQFPVIYWLDVQAVPAPGPVPAYFGWKTSAVHWNDDATWDQTLGPPSFWRELRYPVGHPQAGQSIDLAFMIVGAGFGDETLKWSQPPEPFSACFNGWNEYSVYDSTQWIVADDWPCETDRPITDMHWWGSYLDWDDQVPPSVAPDAFHIGVWTDVPFMPPGFSHPGMLLQDFVVPRSQLNERPVGCDALDSSLAPETCFKYDWHPIPDAILFAQPDPACTVYWISIAAMYMAPPGTIANPWGWKTREHMHMDDAVRIFSPTAPAQGALFDSGEPIQYPAGTSWDMAFVLTTPEEKEACCLMLAVEPVCQLLEPAQCSLQGGIRQGPGTICSAAEEACCMPNGSCVMIDPLCCDEAGGTPLGAGPACNGEFDACCTAGGVCVSADPMCCPLLGGVAQGPFTECGQMEACCMSDGTCQDIDPNCCDEEGGSPQGPGTGCVDTVVACCWIGLTGQTLCSNTDPVCCNDMPQGEISPWASVCLGDNNGNQRDDACDPPCEPTPDHQSCWDAFCPSGPADQCRPKAVRHNVIQPFFPVAGTDTLQPTTGYVDIQYPPPNPIIERYFINPEKLPNITRIVRESPADVSGHREIEAEIIETQLVADGPGGMPVSIRESPTRASAGRVVGPVSGVTDYPADSFFDLFVEIDIPDLGVYGLHNVEKIPMEAHNVTTMPPSCSPTACAAYHSAPSWQGVELLDATEQPTGYRIVAAEHVPPPPPPEWEVIECACTDPDSCHVEWQPGADPICIGGCPSGQCLMSVAVIDPGTVEYRCGCAQIEACCLRGGTCVEVEYNRCVALGGDPQGPNTICDMRVCNPLKWAQPPTFNANAPGAAQCFWGWDDLSMYQMPPIVADDWACATKQPITDIHWWGSYQNWTTQSPPPPAPNFPQMFHIGIWTDVPAGGVANETCCYCWNPPGVLPPTTCSPNPIDQAQCDQWGGGQYQQCTFYANSRCTGDSCAQLLPYSHPGKLIHQWVVPRDASGERYVGCDQYPGMPADTCFRYDFGIPEAEWFYQAPSAEPMDYWISISASYLSAPQQFPWGWKTREHFFNDDAVRILAPPMPIVGSDFGAGQPIETPDGKSWDMAFVLTTRRTAGIKWEQWPNPTLPGLHAHDGITLADNWECQGGKVTDFHWWGNYELDGQGNEVRGAGINCINISIHRNRPDVPWCLPQDPELWGICAFFDALHETWTGMVNSEGAKIYQYDFYLEPGFAQVQGEIYWLDLEATHVNPQQPALWRWQEANRSTSPRLCPAAERTPSQAWHTIVWPDDPPQYSEMAFRVTSRPYPPDPDPTGVDKTRFISFIPGNAGQQTALMVTLDSLHHVNPPYTGGEATDFSAWEGQVRWVGPPAQYRESTASGVLFWASKLQCEPYYADWSTIGLLHVTGAEIIPSSQYDVQAVSDSCLGAETDCADISTALPILTTRWADVEIPYNPPSPTAQPDLADVSGLVNKFRSAPGAPIKARALLSGQVPEMSLDFSFAHISDCVDAFRGRPYPYAGPCACPSTITCNAVACSQTVPCPTGQLCVAGFCRDACERCTP